IAATEAQIRNARASHLHEDQIPQYEKNIQTYRKKIENLKTPYQNEIENYELKITGAKTYLEQNLHNASIVKQEQEYILEAERKKNDLIKKGQIAYYVPDIKHAQTSLKAMRESVVERERALAEVRSKHGLVNAAEQFAAIKDAQLMGPPPGGGAVEAIKK